MEKDVIEKSIQQLKAEYIRIQGDIEKLESTGQSFSLLEGRLDQIEQELNTYYKRLG